MVTFPYPYVNALPHVGSMFTLLRVEFTARYKRMRGYNVLFAQGWHATGGPIVSAALRVREGDPKQIGILRSMGISEEEISRYAKPEYWVEYFSREWRRDLERLGVSVDWRREFYTTGLNPPYSAFVQWQYLKLREKGLVFKGSHPVVWCPKEKKVVGDHDRPDEYVGIGPEQVTIVKFRGGDGRVYPCLTYRPETVYGVTNIWVRVDARYVEADVDGERWVTSRYSLEELADQGHEIRELGEVEGTGLVGMSVKNPVTGEYVPVLPAKFVDPELGTGMVMSVPAHAPYDHVALMEIKKDPGSFGVSRELVEGIEPRSLISLEGYGDFPAAEEVERVGAGSQEEMEKLDRATKKIYTKEYHEGVLKDLFGDLAGMKIWEAKDIITERLVDAGAAIKAYTLPSKVYCRCGARTHIKIVKDQWFLRYSDPGWKDLAHSCVDGMKFHPEEVRDIFHSQIDWLQDWACAHQGELGTRLPWDEGWVVESLSDSTIYMAYYTIAKYLQHPEEYGIDWSRLGPEFFDYVLLGHGDPRKVAERAGMSLRLLKEMKREFEYWYPVDFRNSGKDLLYNHLIFFIFHHAAIFPPDRWPRSVGINGWVLVGGRKMSKTAGNFISIREAIGKWGADATRLASALAGDPALVDPSFDPKLAEQAVNLLYEWYRFSVKNYGEGRGGRLKVDDWFESVLNRTVREVTMLMEETRYRSALVKGFFELQEEFRWYMKRCGRDPNGELLKLFIEVQTLMMAPFTPHLAEEIWEALGKNMLIGEEEWPRSDGSKIDRDLEAAEEIVRRLLDDCREVLSLVKGKPRRLKVILASDWKYSFAEIVREALEKKGKVREAVKIGIDSLEPMRKGEAGRLAQLISRDPGILELLVPSDLERKAIHEATEFLSRELSLPIVVELEDGNPEAKAKLSLPSRPSIIVELEG